MSRNRLERRLGASLAAPLGVGRLLGVFLGDAGTLRAQHGERVVVSDATVLSTGGSHGVVNGARFGATRTDCAELSCTKKSCQPSQSILPRDPLVTEAERGGESPCLPVDDSPKLSP